MYPLFLDASVTVNASTGSISIGGTLTGGGGIKSINGAKGDCSFSFGSDTNTGMYCGATCGTNKLQFSTGNRDRLRIDNAGNVGAGTTLPKATLHILGSGTTAGFALRIADSLATDRMVVLDRGNVGIGTTAPKAKLEIIPADTSSGFYLNLAEAKLIMKSPDGTCSACGPNNSDAWSCASMTCP